MQEYGAIMKTINDKLAEQESVIEFYRTEKVKWEAQTCEQTEKIVQLEAVNKVLVADKEKILQTVQDDEAEIKMLREENEQLKEKIKGLEGDCDNAN